MVRISDARISGTSYGALIVHVAQKYVLGRIGQPGDIAAASVFLASGGSEL